MTLRSLISRLPGLSHVIRIEALTRRIARNLDGFLHHQGGLASDYRIDTATRRVPAVRRRGPPVITPGSHWWMRHAVFNGRPIRFGGRTLIYFCAQERYRTDVTLVIGMADRDGIRPAPVLFADMERHGVNVPAFTVHHNMVIAAYMDTRGPKAVRSSLGHDLIVASSKDGISFEKRRLAAPFKDLRAGGDLLQVGLPWLLADDGALYVYFRGKGRGRSCLIRAALDFETLRLSNFEFFWSPENLVNIAVTKKHDRYWLFHGDSHGGGFYVTASRDGITFSQPSVMITDPEDHGWDWDFGKIAASPINGFEAESTICYLGTAGGKMAIGEAELDLEALLPIFEQGDSA